MTNLLKDERGAVMTEFVIALPVFILIFVGIINLYEIEQASVRMKMVAATNTWNEATWIHDTSDYTEVPHGRPQVASINATAIVANDDDNTFANIAQVARPSHLAVVEQKRRCVEVPGTRHDGRLEMSRGQTSTTPARWSPTETDR